jgi:hypothetical protein
MPGSRLLHLESLLRTRKLDVTLASAQPLRHPETACAPTGLAVLDTRLEGGLPRGQVSELVGPRSSGRAWAACAALAAATRRGELAALVDTVDAFDPQSAAALEPDWPYLLWVRGRSLGSLGGGRPRSGCGRRDDDHPVRRAVERAIKATALVLSAGGFGLLVLDVAGVPSWAIRDLPPATWLRLQRMVEGRDTVCLVMADEPVTRSAGGVSLRAHVPPEGSGCWRGRGPHAKLLAGIDLRLSITRARFHPADTQPIVIAGRPA